jgi:hypothetical protein
MGRCGDAGLTMDRQYEIEAIARFLADRGITRCPTRFAGIVALALDRAEELARIGRLQPPSPVSRQQLARRHSVVCWPTKTRR